MTLHRPARSFFLFGNLTRGENRFYSCFFNVVFMNEIVRLLGCCNSLVFLGFVSYALVPSSLVSSFWTCLRSLYLSRLVDAFYHDIW